MIRMPTAKIRRRLQEDDVLYTLAEIGIATLAVSAPPLAMAGFIIKEIRRKHGKLSASKIKNSFYSLKRRGLLVVESKHGKTRLSLTPEAWRLIRLKTLRLDFEHKRTKHWNGKWYIVMFDINNQKTSARNALRTLIKTLGFAYLQKSAWVFPYECRKELEFLKGFFELRDDELRVLVCDSIGNDKKLREVFRI